MNGCTLVPKSDNPEWESCNTCANSRPMTSGDETGALLLPWESGVAKSNQLSIMYQGNILEILRDTTNLNVRPACRPGSNLQHRCPALDLVVKILNLHSLRLRLHCFVVNEL
jgi:hypothetical protein